MEIPCEIFQHIASFTSDYCDVGRLSIVCDAAKNLVDHKLSLVRKEEIEALYVDAILLGWVPVVEKYCKECSHDIEESILNGLITNVLAEDVNQSKEVYKKIMQIILRSSSSKSTIINLIESEICTSLGIVSEIRKNPILFDISYEYSKLLTEHRVFHNQVEDVRKMVLECVSHKLEKMRMIVCATNCKSLAKEYYDRCIQENVLTSEIYYWLFSYGFIDYDDLIYDYGVPCEADFSSPIQVKDEKVSDNICIYYLKSDRHPKKIVRKIIRYRPHLLHHTMYMKYRDEILENLQDPRYLPFSIENFSLKSLIEAVQNTSSYQMFLHIYPKIQMNVQLRPYGVGILMHLQTLGLTQIKYSYNMKMNALRFAIQNNFTFTNPEKLPWSILFCHESYETLCILCAKYPIQAYHRLHQDRNWNKNITTFQKLNAIFAVLQNATIEDKRKSIPELIDLYGETGIHRFLHLVDEIREK